VAGRFVVPSRASAGGRVVTIFPSAEWMCEWLELTNADPKFRAAGAGWDGSVGCVIQSDQGFPGGNLYLRLTGANGQWSSHVLGPDPELVTDTVFTLSAPYLVWKSVVRQQLHPIRGLIQGKLRVHGQLSAVLRWTRALTTFTELAGQLETTFVDELTS
jgi:putative sterol carrier protein